MSAFLKRHRLRRQFVVDRSYIIAMAILFCIRGTTTGGNTNLGFHIFQHPLIESITHQNLFNPGSALRSISSIRSRCASPSPSTN
jgi:hypothetical protein